MKSYLVRMRSVVRVSLFGNLVFFGLLLICVLNLRPSYTHLEQNVDNTCNSTRDKVIAVLAQDKHELFSTSFEDLLNGPIHLRPEDPLLIKHVKDNVLIPPSNLPYNLSHPEVRDPSAGQTKRALLILENMGHGFFVEAGGLTGERLSNSIYMERFLGWTGLIVEPDPKNFKELLTKKRKAWIANVCLSPQPYPMKVTFAQAGSVGKISSNNVDGNLSKGRVVVQCIPLITLLLAINQTKVDYFSLDVESAELDVLRTIPFNKVDIKLWSVEVDHVLGGSKAIVTYMKRQGYKVHSKVYSTYAGDVMLIKE